jgi:hypothetical protein
VPLRLALPPLLQLRVQLGDFGRRLLELGLGLG